MFDDFWAGYNYGNQPIVLNQKIPQTNQEHLQQKQKMSMGTILRTYNKVKVVKMRGPNNEIGEIYTNGKMYIMYPNGKYQVRSFPSRPFAIRYMQMRGWVVI